MLCKALPLHFRNEELKVAPVIYHGILMMMIMSMGWDVISELRPPTGLLFIPRLIYEYEKLRWNDVDRENYRFVHQSSLAIIPAELSSSVAGGTGGKQINLALQSIFIHTSN
jgi:hypothetical protein